MPTEKGLRKAVFSLVGIERLQVSINLPICLPIDVRDIKFAQDIQPIMALMKQLKDMLLSC